MSKEYQKIRPVSVKPGNSEFDFESTWIYRLSDTEKEEGAEKASETEKNSTA
jgi:hypothetical protein